MKTPWEVYIICLLTLFLSSGAIYGGLNLIFSPDGTLLKMDPDWLNLIPFPNYLIPGIILLFMLGIFPLISLYGLFYKKNIKAFNAFNIFAEKCWGWTFTLYTGIMTIIWITVQQVMAEYFILQSVILATGILIIILCLTPRVQKFYTLSGG